MSKNYDNTIPLFADDAQIKKKIFQIVTDTTPMGEPLNPEQCNVYKLLSYIATPDQLETVRGEYMSGAIGYGHAKQRLLDTFLDYFADAKKRYTQLMNDTTTRNQTIKESTDRIRQIANTHLKEIKTSIGY